MFIGDVKVNTGESIDHCCHGKGDVEAAVDDVAVGHQVVVGEH